MKKLSSVGMSTTGLHERNCIVDDAFEQLMKSIDQMAMLERREKSLNEMRKVDGSTVH